MEKPEEKKNAADGSVEPSDLLAGASMGPNWIPLREKLGDEGCEPFMFMASYPVDRTVVHTYKHRDTRRYLNLDEAGQCYAYQNGYARITDEEAFNHVFG